MQYVHINLKQHLENSYAHNTTQNSKDCWILDSTQKWSKYWCILLWVPLGGGASGFLITGTFFSGAIFLGSSGTLKIWISNDYNEKPNTSEWIKITPILR